MAVTKHAVGSTVAGIQPISRSPISVVLTESKKDRAPRVSPTDNPDTAPTVSSTKAPDRPSTVPLTNTPDRTPHVSPTDVQDRTSTESLTDAPDRTSTVSLTDAPDRTSTVSLTDPPNRTPHVSTIHVQDRTSTESLTDGPDRTSTESLTVAPDRTSTVSPTEDNPSTLLVSNSVPPTTHYVRTPVIPETNPVEWWITTPFMPVHQTTIGGNSLDRFLGIHGNQGNSCPSGQVYYYGRCLVTWQYTTPPPLVSTQEYITAAHTTGTSIQPRSTTNTHVKPPPTTRTHVQTLTTSTDVQSSTRTHVNSTSTTRDSISSPSSNRENDALSINEHTPTLAPTTHNYTGGHLKQLNTTGTSEGEDLSHEPSAVTASTITSPGHVLDKDDTHSTSHLQCNHVILDNSTFNLNPDGSVVLKGGKVINESDFILTPKGQLKVCVTTLGLQGSNTNEKFKIDRNRPTVVLTNICLVSSQVFLILTFLFHCFFSSLRNLPGVILMFLSASLFLAHATFFFGSAQAYNRTTCITIGVVIHFFWLASFCWLSISSFHTFRVFKDVFASRSFEANKKRIILIYSIFGYGIPAVVITAMITANYFVSGSESFGYADTSNFCFVSIGTNSIVGLLVPAGATILVSFTLFILTVVYLCKASANRRKVGNGEKWNMLMYIKLSTITGFSWVFGFLQMVDNSQVFTYLFIFLTGAQGVFIFLAFVANKRTFLLIKHACRKQNKYESYSRNSTDTKPVPSDVGNTV
ncbi:adhesion G-protein coupled receptor G2-like [Haliotis asinina]|uniref:adhesion G-protein coupled receptor G2-like n=1 Tax=Haliotis asinina TaxID=109174 RepID=UPI003531CA06